MMRSLAIAALALFPSCPAVLAWGATGHSTVGTIAQHYLTSQAQTWVSNILGPGVSLASVANWADAYRETTAGQFSASFQ